MASEATGTQANRAVIRLRERILAGEIAGGSRMFEVPLAESLQISRTPVREALSRLAEEGLLERQRGGGYLVRTFTFADVVDAIELRGVLEGTAARLAAERGTAAAALDGLGEVVAALDALFADPAAVDFDRYAVLNADFHTRLAGLAGSEAIRREVARASALPFASPSAFLPNKAEIEAFKRSLWLGQAQHRAILAAIRAREGARAEAVAREHARLARQNLDYILKHEDPRLRLKVPGLALVVE